MNDESPPKEQIGAGDRRSLDMFSRVIAVLVLTVMLCVLVLLSVNLWVHYSNYRDGIEAALVGTPVDAAAVLAYSRAFDSATTKTGALCLGFLLVFLGALYTLRSGDTTFKLSVEGVRGAGALQTSAPGLVMVSLGTLLVALALLSKTTVSYSTEPWQPSAIIEPESREVPMKPMGVEVTQEPQEPQEPNVGPSKEQQ